MLGIRQRTAVASVVIIKKVVVIRFKNSRASILLAKILYDEDLFKHLKAVIKRFGLLDHNCKSNLYVSRFHQTKGH